MAGEGDLKLLGAAMSPFAVRVRMALSMKGVIYEYIEQDLFNKSQLLLESNPVHKKVPVLIHGGKPICESLVIVQYVDEVWGAAAGPSILPVDPYERAVARFWGAYVDDKFFPAWIGIMRAVTEEERAEKVDAALAAAGHLEEAFAQCSKGKAFFAGDSVGYIDLALGCNLFAQCSKGKAFFAGDSVGYIDLALGCNLFWLEALRKMFGVTVIDAGKTPLLAAWAERFGAIEAAKEVVPAADNAVAYAKKIQAHRAAAAATAK